MNFTCQNCHSMIVIQPGERPPPWCSKCGTDFRPDDQRFAALFEGARDEAPPPSTRRPSTGKTRSALPPQPAAPSKPTAKPEVAVETPASDPEPNRQPDTTAEAASGSTLGLKLLALAGVVFLLGGIALGVQKYNWVRNCETATGLVTPDSSGPVVRYIVDGKPYTLRNPDAPLGTILTVRHRPDDPSDAALDNTSSLYRTAGLVTLIGFGLLLTAGSALALRPTTRKPTD